MADDGRSTADAAHRVDGNNGRRAISPGDIKFALMLVLVLAEAVYALESPNFASRRAVVAALPLAALSDSANAVPSGGVPLYAGLGSPKANKANPAGAGNAEGNWWTPSYVLDTDCEGNRVTDPKQLSQECIFQKKRQEIKDKQAINALNAEYKVEKLAQLERQAAERTAKNAARAEEVAARQAKYANRR